MCWLICLLLLLDWFHTASLHAPVVSVGHAQIEHAANLVKHGRNRVVWVSHNGLGKPEVANLKPAGFGVDKDVLGFDVSVDQS